MVTRLCGGSPTLMRLEYGQGDETNSALHSTHLLDLPFAYLFYNPPLSMPNQVNILYEKEDTSGVTTLI